MNSEIRKIESAAFIIGDVNPIYILAVKGLKENGVVQVGVDCVGCEMEFKMKNPDNLSISDLITSKPFEEFIGSIVFSSFSDDETERYFASEVVRCFTEEKS